MAKGGGNHDLHKSIDRDDSDEEENMNHQAYNHYEQKQ